MIEHAADALPIGMLLSAIAGFLAGDAFGDSRRHRKCLQQANDHLRDLIEKERPTDGSLHNAINQNRKVINDIHKPHLRRDKRVFESLLLNPSKSMAGSLRSGRDKTCRLWGIRE